MKNKIERIPENKTLAKVTISDSANFELNDIGYIDSYNKVENGIFGGFGNHYHAVMVRLSDGKIGAVHTDHIEAINAPEVAR